MTYIDDSALEILSTNLDDTNLGYLLDGYFSTIAQREGDITFTVTNRGYKDFVFMNVFCERIDFVFKSEEGDTLLTYSHPMYINAAKNCRELLGGIHSVLTDMADVHFDTSYAGTVEITLKAVQEPSPLCKIGKFSYGVPKQIGDLKWGFTFEDIETEKMGLAEDDPDKIVERYELYSAEAVIETNKIANVRQISRQVKGIKMIWIEPTSGVVLWGKLIFSRISGDNPTSSTIKITIKGIG